MDQDRRGSGMRRFGRVAAVVSSVTLASLYIAYRSGGEQQVLPSSKFRTVQVASKQPATATTATTASSLPSAPDITFYSSKSAPIFSGSKSAAIFLPAGAAATQPTTAQIIDATTAPAPTK